MPSSYSYIEYNGTGSAGPFSFDDIDTFLDVPVKDQVDVYVNDQIKTYTTHYTITDKDVTFTAGNEPASGTTIRIERDTTIADRIVNFTNSSILTAADLNKNTDQLLFLIQEVKDDVDGVALTSVNSIADGAITAEKLKQTTGSEAVVTNSIRPGAVTTAKIADDAVTTDKIADDAVDNDKMSAGAPTWTAGGDVTVLNNLDVDVNLNVDGNAVIDGTASVGGTLTVTGNVTGDTTFSDDVSVLGDMSFNSGYGSSAVAYGCRAWANFTVSTPETTTNPFGGTATVSRTSGSTTAVVTTTNDHGLRVGHKIYAATGVAAAAYVITAVPTTKTFEFTTVATTVLSGAAITFNWRTITASANVHSVSELVANDRFGINLNTTMPDANYAVIANSLHTAESAVSVDTNTATSIMTWTPSTTSYALNSGAVNSIHTAVFR
jgi:hypothetical protein